MTRTVPSHTRGPRERSHEPSVLTHQELDWQEGRTMTFYDGRSVLTLPRPLSIKFDPFYQFTGQFAWSYKVQDRGSKRNKTCKKCDYAKLSELNKKIFFDYLQSIVMAHTALWRTFALSVSKSNIEFLPVSRRGEGKLRAASLRVCEYASLRVVRLYSASHVHDMAQRPWKLGQEPKMNFR